MTSIYAEVIGDPIAHSRSPLIHQFWLDQLGLDARYERQLVPRGGVAAYLQQRRADPAWRGCNVTMPHKLDALALADQASDRAVAAGAANVLIPKDGKIVAANTDVGAIAEILSNLHASGRSMDGITLLGNGGAARAALVALKLVGMSAVRIQARDMAAARKLAVEFGLDVGPAPINASIAGSGVINATPIGMAGKAAYDFDLSGLASNGWVFDMVTDPVETPLIVQARQRNLAVATGLDMLVGQAATSFALFFGVEPPRDRDAQLWQKLMA